MLLTFSDELEMIDLYFLFRRSNPAKRNLYPREVTAND